MTQRWKQGVQYPVTIAALIGAEFFLALPTTAQLLPDNTLGAENSVITSSVNQVGQAADVIAGGARRGGNLFHSFQEFNVGNLQRVYFTNPAGVENILSRVTGSNRSIVRGTLGVLGDANLFLLNPNGILFGPNATLDIRGSFVASTANSVRFADSVEFSALDPSAPPLLTISTPIGLQYGSNPGVLQVQRATLEVPPDQTLALVGGNIIVNGGELVAPGGRVELASVAANSNIDLSVNRSLFQLAFPISTPRDDIAITGGTRVNVLAGGGGDIAINARNLNISGNSRIEAGIGTGMGSMGSQAGSIEIDATQTINLDSSIVLNAVLEGGRGNGGDVVLVTRVLGVTGDIALLGAGLDGEGIAGNVIINARDTVSFDGVGSNGLPNAAGSIVAPLGKGNAGNVVINTNVLTITGGAGLFASTLGAGNAGDVIISARDTVTFSGVSSNGLSSGAYSQATQTGTTGGNGGDIIITTGSLLVTGGAQLGTSTRREGNAGDISIHARNTVRFNGVSSGGIPSGAFSEVAETGIGDGGDIAITAGSLSVTEGAALSTPTLGEGNAGNVMINVRDSVSFDRSSISSAVEGTGRDDGGNINITTENLSLLNGARLLTSTNGQGNSGDVTIIARDTVLLDGSANDFPSVVSSVVGRGGVGNGGSINVQAQHLILRSNAALIGDVEPTGEGRGGSINLDVSGTIHLLGGTTASTGESARITLGVQPDGIGSAGNLHIRTGTLVLQDGGLIKISTQGQGNAGNAFISAGIVDIAGSVPSSGLPSGIFTSSSTAGNAGDIEIETHSFRIADGAALSARSQGDGQGGRITVNANRSFEAVNGGQVITTTFGQGRAGNITVNAVEQITIAGSDPNYAARLSQFPDPISDFVVNAISETGSASGLYADTEPGSTGRGGDITMTAEQITIRDGARVTASSDGSERAGNIRLSASDIRLDTQAAIASNTVGGQGNITLRSPFLLLRNNSTITTNALGAGMGGNINIDAGSGFIVSPLSENNDIFANAEEGSGGQITLSAQGIYGFDVRTREDLQRLLNPINPLDPQRLQTNDITAFSQANPTIDTGSVAVQTPDLDPTQGVAALPIDFTDSSQLISATCPADEGSSFAIIGRGGLPEDPRQPLMGQVVWQDERGEEGEEVREEREGGGAIAEAQGWMIDQHTGAIVLVAQQPQNPLFTSRQIPCAASSISP